MELWKKGGKREGDPRRKYENRDEEKIKIEDPNFVRKVRRG